MRQFGNQLLDFLKNEDGPTAVEYAIMIGLIISVCFATVAVFGTSTNNSFTYSGQRIRTTGS